MYSLLVVIFSFIRWELLTSVWTVYRISSDIASDIHICSAVDIVTWICRVSLFWQLVLVARLNCQLQCPITCSELGSAWGSFGEFACGASLAVADWDTGSDSVLIPGSLRAYCWWISTTIWSYKNSRRVYRTRTSWSIFCFSVHQWFAYRTSSLCWRFSSYYCYWCIWFGIAFRHWVIHAIQASSTIMLLNR